MSDGGVHGRYPARAAVAGSTLDGGQCGGRCRAPIHLSSGEPRSVVVFCRVSALPELLFSDRGQECGENGRRRFDFTSHLYTRLPPRAEICRGRSR